MRHEGSITSTHYKVSEAAARLGVTEQRVRQMCKTRQLQVLKIGNQWWVDKQAVHDRLATRPPKRRSNEAGALEEQRRIAREFAEGNRYLAGELARTRDALVTLGQRYEDTVEKLGERERELREERRRSESHRKDAEGSAKDVALLEAKVERLKAKLREHAASDKPLGENQPRLWKGPEKEGNARRRREPRPGKQGR